MHIWRVMNEAMAARAHRRRWKRSLRTALMGDMVATIAVENGWAGIIINGAVRDVAGKLPSNCY